MVNVGNLAYYGFMIVLITVVELVLCFVSIPVLIIAYPIYLSNGWANMNTVGYVNEW